MSQRNLNIEPLAPVRLEPGQGFETRARRWDVDDFIIVDASLAARVHAPLHAHARAYFTLVLRGGFDEQYGSKAVAISAGTANFVPAGTPHQTHSLGARLVRMEFPESALRLADAVGPVLQQPALIAHPAAVSLGRRVLAEVRSRDHGWRLVVQGLLMELLGHVVRNQAKALRNGIPPWLRRVKDRLDSDWSRSLALGEIARGAGVHPVYLARAFRASYGCSVGEYRRGRQLRAAEERLARSDAALSDVAASCGFADQSHLAKAFRRAFGVSPGRYRRIVRQRG